MPRAATAKQPNQPSKVTPPVAKKNLSEDVKKEVVDLETGFDLIDKIKADKSTFKAPDFEREETIVEYVTLKKEGNTMFLRQDNLRVVDGKNGTRHLRYAPNERSIWADEQGDYIQRESIAFKQRDEGLAYLVVGAEYKQLREFLDKHPDNVANGGHRFKKVDKKKDAEEALKKEFDYHDAMSIIKNKSVAELMPLVYKFDIPTNQSNGDIKLGLIRVGKADPVGFMKAMEDPIVKLQAIIRQGLELSVISHEGDDVVWTDTGDRIVSVIQGKTPEYTMARFCSTDRGLNVYEELVRKIKEALS